MNIRKSLAIITVIFGTTIYVQAQTPVPTVKEPYELDLGTHDNDTMEFKVLPAEVVSRPGTAWMRVALQGANLGVKSFVVLTSLLDGQQQVLDAPTLAAWSSVSAAFMGDAVQI